MKTNNSNLQNLQPQAFNLGLTSAKMNLSEVFAERRKSYLNEFNLFIAHFNAIPNFIHEIEIDCKKANIWFAEYYKNEIKDMYYNKRYYNNNKMAELDDIFYFLSEDLIVDFDTNNSIVRFLFRKTDILKIEQVIVDIKKFKVKKVGRKPELLLLVSYDQVIVPTSLRIERLRISIGINYNDDLMEVHTGILKRLSKNNDKGLVLLHGKPGTGKTTYIRYLISLLKKKVIFLPPNMAGFLTNPELISIMIKNPNSIFVIEDAENIIVDREKDGSSPVSALLNISDGLLSDCLNIQIICTFNTDINKIDNALLRKGRLIARYEFKELEIEKANKLSAKLGFDRNFDTPTLLTEIYNQGEKDFKPGRKRNVIGFVRK